ncbi:MAG: N-acetylmuramoyl-L-alanine amidase family protein [Trueperaceae bacterium]
MTRRLLLSLLLVASLLLLLGLNYQRAGSWSPFPNVFSLNVFQGPVRVGLQIGHLEVSNHPEELANLRYNTGASVNGINEVDVNLIVAQTLRDMLLRENIVVDLLPATVPKNYRADVFVSLHADSNEDSERRGYKSAVSRFERNDKDALLKQMIDEHYFYFSGLPDDDNNVSGSMLEYYAFNKRFKHSIHRNTPAIIVEMGYLSNEDDLAYMEDPANPAYALKIGILSYLREVGRIKE